jgi:hypothetical protein
MPSRFTIFATIFAAFSLLSFLVPPLRAADVRWPGHFEHWTDSGPSPRNAVQINETSKRDPLLQEAGLSSVAFRVYVQGDRKAYFTLYTFHDSSGAYEAFTVLRNHILKAEPGEKPFGKAIYKSNQVLDIVSDSEVESGAQDEAAQWVQSISDGVATPPIASYLPDQERVPGTDRYVLGPVAFQWAAELARLDAATLKDVAGFDSHAEAMFARYKAVKDEATLLLIEYPTPQLAELHLRHLQRALHEAKLSTSSIERKGSLLSIVLGPTSAEYAEKLRGAVKYETEVTWNEPSTTATDPPITSTLVKIIIATMVLMGMAFVLGIAFGGVRVITKRLFPGKVFDRPAQMEVLQLGLSGKPIDPRDMY